MISHEEYIKAHLEMVGMDVVVIGKVGSTEDWQGTVVDVVDKETFLVNDGKRDVKVSMFHIRTHDRCRVPEQAV
jgi:hypothetical protein